MRLILLLLIPALATAQDDLAAKSTRAKQALIEKHYDEAVSLYRELTQSLPNLPGMHMNLGLALQSAGKCQDAITSFQTAIRLSPRVAPAHFLLGICYQRLQKPAMALPSLQQSVRLDPTNKLAALELGDAYFQLRQYENAVATFQSLNGPKAIKGLGLSYTGMSELAFEQLESSASASGYADALTARSQLEQGNLRNAFRYYRQAITKLPSLNGLHEGVAEIYRRSEKADWASKEESLEPKECAGLACEFASRHYGPILQSTRESKIPEHLYWRARAATELSRLALEKLTALPDSAELHELLGESYRLRGMHSEAIQEYSSALRMLPKDTRLTRELARVYWKAGKCPEAEALLNNASDAEGLYMFGDCSGDVKVLQQAVSLDPNALSARAALGKRLLEAGNAAQAISHLEAAKSLDPKILFQLSQAYKSTGKVALSRQTLAEYQKLIRKRSESETSVPEITPP